jgi:hypothetical protein
MRYIQAGPKQCTVFRAAKQMGMTTSIRRALAAVPLLVAGLSLHAQAQSTVYKCVDDHGRVELTDTAKRGCKPLDLPGFIQAPPARQGPARQGGSNARPPVAAPAPGDFPRVGAAEQRARDDDRRTILDDELRNEQKKLLDLKRDFNNGAPGRQAGEKDNAGYQQRVSRMREDIARSESNIEALKRELASIR